MWQHFSLPLAVKKGKKKTEQDELNKLCEGHRFNCLKLVKVLK